MSTRGIESNTDRLPEPQQLDGTGTVFPRVEFEVLAPNLEELPDTVPKDFSNDFKPNASVINILILEDCDNDLILRLPELEQRGYVPLPLRVETREDFLAALKSRQWDIVISDHVLTKFNGPEALKLLRNQGLDIPFIMVSDVFGEEKAAIMMKAGANDYLTKGNLSRLVPVLERELKAAQDRRQFKRAVGAIQNLAATALKLQDMVECAVSVCGNSLMLEPHYPGPVAATQFDAGTALTLENDCAQFPTLEELEMQHIFAALDRCQGNRRAAAALLDVSERTLRNKLHKYNGTSPNPWPHRNSS